MQTVARIAAFQDCGAYAYVYQTVNTPIEYRIGGSSCRDRFCVPCARDRSRVLATNVLTALDDQPARFLTLTLKTNDGPLSTQLDRLFSCFTLLRKRQLWHTAVTGGCAFLEINWSPSASGWNVHLHCIIKGTYVSQSSLSAAWWKITGDSMILDIRIIRDKQHVGRYVTKYVSKPLNSTYVNRPECFDEVVRALVGRRLCFTFGTWRGIKLTQTPEHGEWINIGSFHEVLQRAKTGDVDALAAITYIAGDGTRNLLDAVEEPRPPPRFIAPHQRQIDFEWCGPDPRF